MIDCSYEDLIICYAVCQYILEIILDVLSGLLPLIKPIQILNKILIFFRITLEQCHISVTNHWYSMFVAKNSISFITFGGRDALLSLD